jgi:hypothetical protein
MTYQQEMLARSFSHIEDDMIEAAHAPRKKVRRVIPVVIAACLIAALWVAFPYLREVIDTNSDILNPEEGSAEADSPLSKPESSPILELNTRIIMPNGTSLTLMDVTETTATFEMVSVPGSQVYAMLYDLRGGALATTEPGYKENGVLIRPNTIKVYVDGRDTLVYALPTGAGTYRITLDFASVRNGAYPMQDYIGIYAYDDETKKTAMVLFFSLKVPEESETNTTGETETP